MGATTDTSAAPEPPFSPEIDEGDRVGENHDDDDANQTEVPDQPAEPQIHDDAEDRQDGRSEHADKGSELGFLLSVPGR